MSIWGFTLEAITKIAGAATGVLTAGALIWRYWGKKYYAHYKAGRTTRFETAMAVHKLNHEELKKNTALTQDLIIRINNLEHHFSPNGGESILDKIDSNSILLERLFIGQRITRAAMGLMYWETDENGNVVYVSSNLCEELGCSVKDFLGRSWKGLVVYADRDRVTRAYEDAIKNASVFKEEFSFRCLDGSGSVKVKASSQYEKDRDQNLVMSLIKFTVKTETHA